MTNSKINFPHLILENPGKRTFLNVLKALFIHPLILTSICGKIKQIPPSNDQIEDTNKHPYCQSFPFIWNLWCLPPASTNELTGQKWAATDAAECPSVTVQMGIYHIFIPRRDAISTEIRKHRFDNYHLENYSWNEIIIKGTLNPTVKPKTLHWPPNHLWALIDW